MDLHKIKEIKETSSVKEANFLLRRNWRILAIGIKKGKIYFSLGCEDSKNLPIT